MAKGTEYAIAIKIAGKIDKSLSNAVKNTNKQLNSVNSKSKKIASIAGSTLKASGAVIGGAFAAATAAAIGFSVKAVKAGAEYETQLRNVSTLLDGTAEQVNNRTNEIGKEILDLSNKTGAATSDLTDGMYQVISAFGDSKDSVGILEVATKAAVAGNATTTESINMLSAVTKGYGDTSLEAQKKAADLAFQTVKLGQTTFPELASSMGKVIPLAATMGVKQEELFGAMATLTGVTGGTAEVTTQLRGAVQGFLQPTDAMSAAMKKLGYADGQAMINSLGLQGSLDALKKSVGGNEIAFSNLFSSVEAKNAVLALTGAQAKNFTEKTKAMYEATGMTDLAFARQTDTFEYSVKMIKNLGTNFMTEVGQKLLPYVRVFAEDALPLITDSIDKLLPAFDQVFAAIDFDSLSEISGDLLPVISDLIAQLAPTLSQILPPIISTGGVLAKTLLPVIGDLINGVLPAVLPILDPLLQIILLLAPVLESLGPCVTVLAQVLSGVLVNALEVCMPTIEGLTTILTGVLDFITNIFTGNFTLAFENLVTIFSGIWQTLKAAFVAPINFIIRGLNTFIGYLNTLKIPDWVPGVGGKGLNFSLIPEIALAEGGIAMGPTNALIAEGGEPEAVLPLSKLPALLQEYNNEPKDPKPRGVGGATYYITFAPVINCPGGDEEKISDIMTDEYDRFKEFMDQYVHDNDRKKF